ncbi:MAG: cytochrome c oxidase assembly protein [Nitrososphaerota archaeon]|nr:cytochrome c oxidase assembly protein [Nitrososphaerota archaeon]MDG6940129.1 cytochrome c oxidase assembly protein [Nitrososphaerota archaeon]
MLEEAVELFRSDRRALLYVVCGAALVVCMLTPPADGLSDSVLAFHMFGEHFAFIGGPCLFLEGVLRAAPGGLAGRACRFFSRANHRYNSKGALTLPAAAALLVYWHLPANFDYAVYHPVVHALFHASMLLVGVLFYFTLKAASKTELLALQFSFGYVMLALGLLFSSSRVYTAYSAYQNALTGEVMLLFMPITTLATFVQAVRVFRKYLGPD